MNKLEVKLRNRLLGLEGVLGDAVLHLLGSTLAADELRNTVEGVGDPEAVQKVSRVLLDALAVCPALMRLKTELQIAKKQAAMLGQTWNSPSSPPTEATHMALPVQWLDSCWKDLFDTFSSILTGWVIASLQLGVASQTRLIQGEVVILSGRRSGPCPR